MADFFDTNGQFKSRRGPVGSDILSAHSPRKIEPEGLFQPIIFYNRNMKVSFHHEQVPFSFSSNTVFTTKDEAVAFLPMYIRQLIKNGDLPAEAVNEDGSVNEDIVRTAVLPLKVGALEKAD